MNNKNNKIPAKIICITIAAIASAALTVPSMHAIKNVPGNNFSTEMEFIATTLLVFGLWFLGIMAIIWSIKSLINSGGVKKNPKGTKSLATLRKVFIGFLNVACIYLSIVFSITACAFLGLAVPFAVWILFVLANVCIILLALACGMSDFIMMMKLRRNPHNQKAINTREKGKTFFKYLVLAYILLYALMFICLSLQGA